MSCRVCQAKEYKQELCIQHYQEFDYWRCNTNSMEVLVATDQVGMYVKIKSEELGI